MATEQIPKDNVHELLEERIAYLELLDSFHSEVVKIIRACASDESLSSNECLREIVRFIQRRLDFYLVTILALDDVARDLFPLVAAGEEADNPEIRNLRFRLGEGIPGHCAKAGTTVRVDDVTQDPRYVRRLLKTQSKLCIPIRTKQRIVGVLDIEDQKRGRFSAEFTRALENVAMNVGFVLETKRLYDDLKDRSTQLEGRVAEKLADLKKSEDRYRRIVENAADPIFLTDLEGRLTWVNRAFCNALGFGASELDGMNVSRLVKKGNLYMVYTVLHEVADGKEAKSRRITLLSRGGEERVFEISCLGFHENGSVTGMQATLRDITEKTVHDKLTKNYMHSLEDAVVERTAEIKDTQRASILAIANLAESIDDDTGGHIQRIRHYSKALAEELKRDSKYKEQITDEYVEMIYDLSPLHDLGKVGIRDYILQKPDKLSEDEFERMKDHTEIGGRALRMAGAMIHRDSLFSIAEMIARFHHEKWDGTGYPAADVGGEHRPLRGEEIPLCARIVTLADVYDALTSKRPYKMPFPHERARDMILRESGNHFDPEIVVAFQRCEKSFVEIRSQFPDTELAEGKPFELPARDRV